MLHSLFNNFKSLRGYMLTITQFQITLRRNVSAVAKPAKLQSNPPSPTFAKDIILYKSENERFMRILGLFSLSQLGFWGFLSYSTMSLKDVPVQNTTGEDLPFYRRINLGDELHKRVLAGVYAAIGYLILTGGWIYIVRSIRYIILRKDGSKISLVTYHPAGKNRIMDVPLDCVSAAGSRAAGKSYIPIRLKNRRLFYLLDTAGTFPRPELFDRTVGVHRKF